MAKPPITDVTEQKRLNEAREAGIPWKKWGPYLSERQWGTVREDYSDDGNAWDYFSHDQARSRAYRWGEDGLGGISRRQAAPVLRARAVERAGSDPEGAPVRAHQQRGQPRRGREGVLLLRRQHAHALVHEVPVQVPAAGVSRTGTSSRRTGAARARSSSTSCSTRASSTTTGTSTCSWSTRRRARKTSSSASPSTTAGRRRPGCACCRRCGSATRGPGATTSAKPSLRAAGPGVIQASHPELGEYWLSCDGAPGAALHREREQRRPALGPAERVALRQGRVPRLRRLGPGRGGEPRPGRDQGRGPLRARRARRRQPDGPPAAVGRPARRTPFDGFDETFDSRIADADEFYAADHAAIAERGRAPRAPPGAGRHAVEQAVLLLRPRAVAERAQEPPAARIRPAGRAEHRVVPHAQRRHHLDAGQVGVPVVRGLGPGLPHHRRWRWWTSTSPRSSCC